jgi:hypothetical protein
MGKRVGFGKMPMAPHNLPFAVIGAAMLWVGWFGFNAGSALGANGLASSAFMATHTAASLAALGWMLAEWIKNGKPTMLGAASRRAGEKNRGFKSVAVLLRDGLASTPANSKSSLFHRFRMKLFK